MIGSDLRMGLPVLGLVLLAALALSLTGLPDETRRHLGEHHSRRAAQSAIAGEEPGEGVAEGSDQSPAVTLVFASSLVLGLAAVAFLGLLLGQWGHTTVEAWLVASLVGLSPIHLRFMIADSPRALLVVACLAATAYFYRRFARRGRRAMLLWSFVPLAVAVGQLLHPITLSVPAVAYGYVALGATRRERLARRRALLSTFIVLTALVMLAPWLPGLSSGAIGGLSGGAGLAMDGAWLRIARHVALDFHLAHPLLLALAVLGALEILGRSRRTTLFAVLLAAWLVSVAYPPLSSDGGQGLAVYTATMAPLYLFTAAGAVSLNRRVEHSWRGSLVLYGVLLVVLLHYQFLYHGVMQRLMFR